MLGPIVQLAAAAATITVGSIYGYNAGQALVAEVAARKAALPQEPIAVTGIEPCQTVTITAPPNGSTQPTS